MPDWNQPVAEIWCDLIQGGVNCRYGLDTFFIGATKVALFLAKKNGKQKNQKKLMNTCSALQLIRMFTTYKLKALYARQDCRI